MQTQNNLSTYPTDIKMYEIIRMIGQGAFAKVQNNII